MCVIIVLVLLFDALARSDLESVIFRVQLVTWRIDTHEDDDSITKDAHVASVTYVIDAGDYAAAEEAYELLSSSGIDVTDAIAGAPTTKAPKRIFATITLVPQLPPPVTTVRTRVFANALCYSVSHCCCCYQ